MKNTNSLLKKTLLASFVLLSTGCKVRDWAGKKSSEARNEVAKETKSCDQFKTDAQGDGENEVILTGLDYKFNLYWAGTDSKVSFWEDKMINENVYCSFQPLTLHVLDQNNAELKAVVCAENKINATACISPLETMVKMIKEARDSLAARGANVSEGKDFTFKCSQQFAEEKIAALAAI